MRNLHEYTLNELSYVAVEFAKAYKRNSKLKFDDWFVHFKLKHKNWMELATTKRPPRFIGAGIHMREQPFGPYVKGDTCWDADEGELRWNGKNWTPHK